MLGNNTIVIRTIYIVV